MASTLLSSWNIFKPSQLLLLVLLLIASSYHYCSAKQDSASSSSSESSSSTSNKPNVLLVIVDDLSTAISAYGGIAKTPNMERLRKQGVQFQFHYTSVPVCSPSRTAILTGLRPDTTQIWTIGPYFRNIQHNNGIRTLPEHFRKSGYYVTGAGKIFHPGSPSGGLTHYEGGADMCPSQSSINNCTRQPTLDEIGSWSEPYWFCDQFTNDTVQSPAMQQWSCSNSTFPSCGDGCVQPGHCIECFKECGSWGNDNPIQSDCECPDSCYPEGLIVDKTIQVLQSRAISSQQQPWFHAIGLKRPHLSYRAPKRFFDMYPLQDIPLPKHRYPSKSSPGISYAHTCIRGDIQMHRGQQQQTAFPKEFFDHMGTSIYTPSSQPEESSYQSSVRHGSLSESAPSIGHRKNCEPHTVHKDHPTILKNGTKYDSSQIEIIHNDTVVKELRQAYYATITFMDEQLGRILDKLENLGLINNTIITLICDHGYQNGQRGMWCKSTLYELTSRVPLFVVVPDSIRNDNNRNHPGGDGNDDKPNITYNLNKKSGDFEIHNKRSQWKRNSIVNDAIVESLDIYPTLIDLADLPLPSSSKHLYQRAQTLAGESFRTLLLKDDDDRDEEKKSEVSKRQKTWALSQWPRRPSCVYNHQCLDGSGNPFDFEPDQANMGYRLRTLSWSYTVWFEFDYGDDTSTSCTTRNCERNEIGQNDDLQRKADVAGGGGSDVTPKWDQITAQELYDLRNFTTTDGGNHLELENEEMDNVAYDQEYKIIKEQLHHQLIQAIQTGTMGPIILQKKI